MTYVPVSYSIFLLTVLTIALCVWLTVANSFALRAEGLTDLERKGELVFAHVVCDFFNKNSLYWKLLLV